jgi:transcriptional regulator with XRE-family HTH domain
MDRFRALLHPAYMAKDRPTRHFLRAWRKHRGYTLEQVAEQIHTTHATLSRIERGKLPYNQDLLEVLAEIYQTDPASLLWRDPEAPDAIWTIWDQLDPTARTQLVEMGKVLKRTGTEG